MKIGCENTNISVYIIDEKRRPVPNKLGYFTCKQGSITSFDSTDTDGIAQAEYTSGNTAGYDTISVKLTNLEGKVVSDSVSIQVLYTTQLTLIRLNKVDFYTGYEGRSIQRIEIIRDDEYVSGFYSNMFVGVNLELPERSYFRVQMKLLGELSFSIGVCQLSL